MSYPDSRDISEAVLPIVSEAGIAAWRRRLGSRVILRGTRYWQETSPGLYQTVPWLARLGREEARRPTPWCWGYRTTLRDDDADFANGSMPVNLLSRLDDYDLAALPSKRRNQLRRCRERVMLIHVGSPALLLDHGYEVYRSAVERLQLYPPPPKAHYQRAIEELFRDSPMLVIAGLVDGRLGGYLEAYAVGATAYIHHLYIATWALPSNICTGLTFEMVQMCRRAGAIREIVYGQHSRENPRLDVYKQGMGFPLVHIPARVWILGPVERVLRWRRPHAHYRLTGQA